MLDVNEEDEPGNGEDAGVGIAGDLRKASTVQAGSRSKTRRREDERSGDRRCRGAALIIMVER